MSHKFSSGVCVKIPSWHRFENLVETAPKTVGEFMTLAGQSWRVVHKPVCDETGRVVTQRIEYADGTVEDRPVSKIAMREDTGACLGIVGPNTQILQNVEAFSPLQTYLDSGLITLETAGCLEGGAKVWTLAKINRPSFDIGGGDTIDKYLLVSNSHDGTLAVRVGITGVRVVCHNTLSLAHVKGDAAKDLIRIRHSRQVQVKTQDAIANIERVNEAMDKGFSCYAELAKATISGSKARQYFKDVFNMPEENVPKQSRDLLDDLMTRYDANVSLTRELLANYQQSQQVATEAQEIIGGKILEDILTEKMETGIGQTQGKESWWSAYNAVTEYLTHERGRSDETRFSSLYYGDSAKKNDRAFELAMLGAGLQSA